MAMGARWGMTMGQAMGMMMGIITVMSMVTRMGNHGHR